MNELPTRFTRLWITRCLTGVLCALLAACAHRPPEPAENVTDLLHDDFYAQPLEPVDPQSVFAFSLTLPAALVTAAWVGATKLPAAFLIRPSGSLLDTA